MGTPLVSAAAKLACADVCVFVEVPVLVTCELEDLCVDCDSCFLRLRISDCEKEQQTSIKKLVGTKVHK